LSQFYGFKEKGVICALDRREGEERIVRWQGGENDRICHRRASKVNPRLIGKNDARFNEKCMTTEVGAEMGEMKGFRGTPKGRRKKGDRGGKTAFWFKNYAQKTH